MAGRRVSGRRRRRLHRRTPGRRPAPGGPRGPWRSTSSRSTSGTRSTTTPRTCTATSPQGTCSEARARGCRREVYNLAADMGGMGFIENNKAALHALGADQHPPAAGRPRRAASSASSTPPRPASTTPTSRRDPDVTRAQGRRRLPGHARGRLRLGEAVQRADVPPLPRGLRPRDPRRPLPQRLRPARHLGRRPREGPGGDLPQGDRRPSSPATTRSRSGATASRRAASCTSTTASRARGGSWTATSIEPLNLGCDELVTINELVDIVEEIAGVKLERHYNLDAPKGVRGRNSDNTLIKELLGWEPSIRLEDGLAKTYAWIYDQMTQPADAPRSCGQPAPDPRLRRPPVPGRAQSRSHDAATRSSMPTAAGSQQVAATLDPPRGRPAGPALRRRVRCPVRALLRRPPTESRGQLRKAPR